jgi:indolepyruvate ferredoxin oxidoreductase
VNADSFGIRLTGVGGTGVVTVSQVLATAGLIAGWHARSLDQTGLAQKGGAVVSDVRFSRTGRALTNKLGAGECDLYLGCDLLVAADPKNLAVTGADRTVAVVSVAEVPTGPMVSDPARSFPDRAAVTEPITDRVRDGAVLLDARRVVLGLFGDDQFANVFLVGAGFQTGALPLPPDAIEEALRVNGVAVDKNIQAFRRGRQYIADRAALLTAAGLDSPAPADTGESPLDRLIRTRSSDLTAYQDQAYARRYLDVVERVRAAEQDKTPGSAALTEAVARYLYKLMAYKDEYEVARLSLESSLGAGLEAEFGPGARASWRLHAAGPAGPRHAAEGRARPVVRPGLPGPAGDARGAGHAAGPVRPHAGAGHRTRADRGVPRPGRPPDRPPEPGHRGASRAVGLAA